MIMVIANRYDASYPLPVRQVDVLPQASFRFSLAGDTLAVRYHFPLLGVPGTFNPTPPPETEPVKALRAMLGEP